MFLSQALELWLERYKPSSRSINSHRLNKLLEFVAPSLPLDEVSVHDLLRYQKGLKAYRFMRNGKQQSYAQKTIRMHMIAVRTFFNWCVKNDLLEKNPTRLMKIPVEPVDKTRNKVMDEKDLQVILAYVKPKPLQNALVNFAYQTACRTGELCSLRISNLRLGKPFTWINPQTKTEMHYYTTLVTGKTGEREVAFYEETAQALRRWLLMRPALEHDFVFVTRTGTPFSANHCKQVMRRLREGIKKDLGYEVKVGNIQSMRKRMGHVMGDSDATPTLIQEKLGHKNLQSTMVYVPKDKASAYSRAAVHMVEPALPDDDNEANILPISSNQ